MRKIRKAKVITALSLTVVMLAAMAGIAAANPENVVVTPANQQLDLGQTPTSGTFTTYNIAVSQIKVGGNTHTIYGNTTLIVAGAGSLGDLMFRFNHGTAQSGWLSNTQTWTWTDGGSDTDSLTVDVMNTGSAPDTEYQFRVYDSYPIGTGYDSAHGTTYGTSIPEFATIAIPVAAILGLVLFFNHRKRKE